MTLVISNTLSGEREVFEPRNPDNVLLYYCGLTVSDFPHLGHARSWVHVDTMRRWLEYLGYTVKHVENFTDVNEKIVARVPEEQFGDSELAVARFFIQETLLDMRGLNLKRPFVYPRVSEHIPEIISLIESLIADGYAYESNGSVYFDVTTFREYGSLSNQNIEELEPQGTPQELDDKRHPADFALWKAGSVHPSTVAEHLQSGITPPDEPRGETWDSPWAEGRPGWHVECSAMSMTHLGDQIDLHVGGHDLIFPHHENEIAQSEAATGEQFAKYWMHVNLLETAGEKMSSSLQNYFTVHNAVDEFGGNAVRMFLLSTQYSQRQTFSENALHEAVERWDRLARVYDRLVETIDSPDAVATTTSQRLQTALSDAREEFTAAMNDDFNTREALQVLFSVVRHINSYLDEKRPYDYRALMQALEFFDTFAADVLGFEFVDSDDSNELVDELIELVLSIRDEAREAGEYEQADELRSRLESLGITIEDQEKGTTFHR